MSTTTTPEPADVGTVWRRGDTGFDIEVSGFNTAFGHRPAITVRPVGTTQIACAIRYARAEGLAVSVLSTGHGATAAISGGMALSMRGCTAVTVDPATGTATIGGGARWRDVLAATAPYGLGGLCGSSSDVGVAGYTLGGGLPVLGRAFGFACDHVRSLELVTADGGVRTVEADDRELFWALRGAGHGLGVIASITIDLVPLKQIAGGGLFFDIADAAAVLAAYAAFSAEAPDALCTSLAFLRLPAMPQVPEPLRGRAVVHLRVTHPDPTADLDGLLAPMRTCAPAIIDQVGVLPYAGLDAIHRDPDTPAPVIDRGALIDTLDPAACDALIGQVGPDTACPLLLAELRHLGAALAAERDNAAGRITAAFSLYAVGLDAGSGEAAVALQRLFTAMEPWSSPRTLVNLRGCAPRGERDAADTDETAHERLRAVKSLLDPDGVFGRAEAFA